MDIPLEHVKSVKISQSVCMFLVLPLAHLGLTFKKIEMFPIENPKKDSQYILLY